MELYATGFNAWSQLQFGKTWKPTELTDDFYEFTKVFVDDCIVGVLASLSSTSVGTSNGLHTAGFQDYSTELVHSMLTSTVAKSGNGRIAFYGPGNVAIDEHNLPADGGLGSIAHSLKEMGNLAQIVAYETGFAALNAKGEVYTWGDSRYPACLGRDTDETSPPSTPGLVADLVGLPTGKITKIAAGGYLLMAVTEAHDLYAWGGHPGQPALIEGLSHNPSPVVVEENDVVDMAVGAHHAIILTEGRELFVIGENANGQLGLPKEKKTVSWTKVPFPLEPGSSIHSVACGPRNTFVIVRKE